MNDKCACGGQVRWNALLGREQHRMTPLCEKCYKRQLCQGNVTFAQQVKTK